MISSSVTPFSFSLHSFPASGFFSSESALLIGWTKYWSFNFSISPHNDYSGLISFRIDWLNLQSHGVCPRVSQESSPAPQFESINPLVFKLRGPILLSVQDYWKNHSFHYLDLCQPFHGCSQHPW